MKKLVIAIDGPAGAGKSSVAKVLAKRLSYTYLDTGAMYRAITYEALRRGVSDEAAVTAMAETLTMDIFPKTDTMHVTVDGEDITDKLRGTDVSQHVSKISSMAGVRAVMVKLQREKALKGGIVLDGRDIGTVVLPQADVKIFLTASVKNRALRRFHEMKDNSESISLEDIEKNIQERDWQDSHRSVSPLKQAKDAILIDNSDMTLEGTADAIIEICKLTCDESN
jgi:hypothetical protein